MFSDGRNVPASNRLLRASSDHSLNNYTANGQNPKGITPSNHKIVNGFQNNGFQNNGFQSKVPGTTPGGKKTPKKVRKNSFN